MRVRHIIHRDGRQLRLTLSRGEGGEGPLIRLGDPLRVCPAAILLDVNGAELLAAFLMSARLAAVGELAEESCNGDYPYRLRLSAQAGVARVEIDQLGQQLLIARSLWDRLYAELQLVLAHSRQLSRTAATSGVSAIETRRVLH